MAINADWVEWAREYIRHHGAPPPVDCVDLDALGMIDALIDCWPPFLGLDEDRVLKMIDHEREDTAARFCALNFLYRLSNMVTSVDEPGDATARARLWDLFGEVVRRRNFVGISDSPTVRWEANIAWIAGERILGTQLFEQLEVLCPQSPGSLDATLGRFWFSSLIIEFPWDDDPPEPTLLFGDWTGEALRLAMANLFVNAVAFKHVAPEHRQWLGETVDVPSRTIGYLESAKKKARTLHDPLKAVLAWCYVARGISMDSPADLKRGAILYRELGDHPNWSDAIEFIETLKPYLYSNAAKAYQLAGATDEAIEIASLVANQYPDALGSWEQLAELQAKKHNYRDAFESLSNEISRNPKYANDWKSTLIIELGTRASSDQIISALTAGRSDSVALATKVVRRHWDTFLRLAPQTQNEWITGLVLMTDGEISTRLGEAAWTYSGIAFGKAVECELRTQVFEEFRRSVAPSRPSSVMLDTNNLQVDKRSLPLHRYVSLGSHLTLGEMLKYLSWSGPQDPIVRRFGEWTKMNFPKLSAAVVAMPRIAALRNLAAHESRMSELEAEELFQLSTALLDRLERRDRKGAI